MTLDDLNSLKNKVNKIVENIGTLIKNQRAEKGWSMAHLASLCGLSPTLVNDLEHHKGAVPNIYTLMALAKALELPDDEFIKLFWSKVNNEHQDKINKQARLKTVLTEYGLPPKYISKVMTNIDFYKALDSLGDTYKTIKHIYDTELEHGTKQSDVMIDPALIIEAKKNIDIIEQAKKDISK